MPETDPAIPRKRPTGRRTGESGTRAAILDAARDLFSEHGYEGASIRAIAMRAGVDSGLIRHFYGDKESLFAVTMADRTVIPERMALAFLGAPEGLGARMTDAYLRLWEDEDTRPILLGLVRSAMTSPRAAELLAEVLTSRVRENATLPAVDDPQAQRRVLAASHLFGVAVARHVIRLPIVADMSHQELVAQLAPTIQAYLDPGAGDR